MTWHLLLQLPPLTRQSEVQLIAKAKRLGMPPEDYARQLVEDALALQRRAEKSSFAEIMAPVRESTGAIDEAEIVKLVENVRGTHSRRGPRGKRK